MKKGIILILICTICFSFLTCRKRLSNPINLYGVWVSNNGSCGYLYLIINKNGFSQYGTDSPAIGCHDKVFKGKSRITNHHLYVGITKFEILEQPELVSGNEVRGWAKIISNQIDKKGIVTAKMKLKNSLLHGRNDLQFYKVIDY